MALIVLRFSSSCYLYPHIISETSCHFSLSLAPTAVGKMIAILPILSFAICALAQANTPQPAAAADPPTTGTDTAPESIGTVDACGPKIPDPTVPDSCDTPIEQVDAPSSYGVQCLDLGSGPNLNLTTCATLIPQLCSNEWQEPNQWLWLSGEGCSLGSFLTNETGAAPWPSGDQCEELIYVSMIESCEYSNQTYNTAAVNLRTIPDNTPTGKGSQVNAGYGSYIVSYEQPRNLSDATCTAPGAPSQPCAALGLPAAELKNGV